MRLLASPTSPFARKVRIALAEKKIEYALVEVSPWTAEDAVAALNPLAKIPVLVVEDGLNLYDSRVIVEYLDSVSPVSRLIPEPARQRIAVRRWEALADGICDAAAAIVLEHKRPVRQQSREWVDRQRRKVEQGVAELARELADKLWCNGEG
jgi:glutathione S-transferase